MRILKRILFGLFVLLGIVLLTCVGIIVVDQNRSSYLDIKGSEGGEVNSYLIRNVHVIPMTSDTVLRNRTVYIESGRIAAIDSDLVVDDIPIVDGNQGYLMPGLVDMHVHVWDEYELGLYLANGVTTIRNLWGMPMHLRIKEKVEKGEIFAPLFYTTGPKLTGPEFIGDDNLNLSSPEEARDKVRSYKARGYDFIKSYYGTPKEIFDAIIEEAEIQEMEIVAHPSQKVPYSYHLHPQIASIEHAEDIVQQPLNYQLDTPGLVEVVTELSNAPHTSFCPTLIAYYNIYKMMQDDAILSSEQVDYINPLIKREDSQAQFDRWHNAKEEDPTIIGRILDQHAFHLLAMKKMHEAGVNIICGTDAGIGVTVPGASIHEELELYGQAGLSNYHVLRTATANVTHTHDKLSEIGTIEEGKLANVILLRDNPLEDLEALKQPELVFVKGRKLEPNHLQTFKLKAKGRRNLVSTIFRYGENLLVEK